MYAAITKDFEMCEFLMFVRAHLDARNYYYSKRTWPTSETLVPCNAPNELFNINENTLDQMTLVGIYPPYQTKILKVCCLLLGHLSRSIHAEKDLFQFLNSASNNVFIL